MLCTMLWLLSAFMLENVIASMILVKDQMCLLCTLDYVLMTVCERFDLPTLQANLVGSIHDTSWSSSRQGLGRWIIDVQSRDLLPELRAHYIEFSGEVDEPIWNELLKCELKWLKSYWSRARTKCYVRRSPLEPRRVPILLYGSHLWVHDGSKYFRTGATSRAVVPAPGEN